MSDLNWYLIVVDYTMQLQVHNISNFYTDQTATASIKIPLFKAGNQLSPDRQCNNLVQLSDTKFFLLCKATTAGSVLAYVRVHG